MTVRPSQDVQVRQDGFGVRRIDGDGPGGRVEVLEVAHILATPAAEQAIRARATCSVNQDSPVVAPIVGISRAGQALSIRTAAPDGVTLADLLAALEFRSLELSDEALLELAGSTIDAVAHVHGVSAAAVHGALMPAHVIIRRDGDVVLTGSVFGDALEALQYNRERLWREFGIALPPSASLPRFDQRADLTQLGALVLAILLRRPLAASEYPRGVHDLVLAATAHLGANTESASALRMWLQQAFQLHPKAMFASAADAVHIYGAAIARAEGRRRGQQALQRAVLQLCGDADAVARDSRFEVRDSKSASRIPDHEFSTSVSTSASTRGVPAPPRGFSFLRNVFPMSRAN